MAVSNYWVDQKQRNTNMSAKIIPRKKTVSSNLFLSNKSFHRFEQHIIFKLMTCCFHNSIASTATDNDLLILKQWKGFFFLNIFFRRPRSWGITLHTKRTEQLDEAVHGEMSEENLVYCCSTKLSAPRWAWFLGREGRVKKEEVALRHIDPTSTCGSLNYYVANAPAKI